MLETLENQLKDIEMYPMLSNMLYIAKIFCGCPFCECIFCIARIFCEHQFQLTGTNVFVSNIVWR